jgi:hypothetical protein
MSGFCFLGPTLCIERAKSLFPDGIFLPPACGGDILSLLKYDPHFVGLIDGRFGTRPSVWHKEILFAIGNQCPVYGASSMGALRASELWGYGMIGIGQVFEWYRDGRVIGDDEVALIHAPAGYGYKALSTALIDFRISLNRCVESGAVSIHDATRLISCLQQMHFSERTWEVAESLVEQWSGCEAMTSRMFQSIDRTSAKRADAEELLSLLARADKADSSTVLTFEPKSLLTSSFRALIGRVVSRPLAYEGEWVRKSDRAGLSLRFAPAHYMLTSIVARAMSLQPSSVLWEDSNSTVAKALRIYVNLQVTQCFGPSAGDGARDYRSIHGSTLDRAAGVVGHLLESVTTKPLYMQNGNAARTRMMAALSSLVEPNSRLLDDVLSRYEIVIGDLPCIIDTMLDIERFIMSYRMDPEDVPDLSIDWWEMAMSLLQVEALAEAVGKPLELARLARILMTSKPNDYNLVRFGFLEGAEELAAAA